MNHSKTFKTGIVTALLLLLPLLSLAQSGGNALASGRWREALRKCAENATIRFDNGVYKGDTIDGVCCGLGMYCWNDGTFYIAVMTATNDDEVGWQTSRYEKGVFTHFLIQGLKGEANSDGNRYITIQELYYYVYRHVVEETEQYASKQTPQLFGKFNLGLIVGTVAPR